MLEIRRIDEAAKPKKAFLMSGAFNPYTIGHEEAARQGVHAAKKTGHTHFYHGVGASAETEDAPLTHAQKTSVIKASHRHIKKGVKGIKMGVLSREHDNPFKQVLHLAKTGHTHVTLGLGSDQMKKTALRGQLEKHVAKHGGIKDTEGKVHPVTLAFRKMGKKRDERPLHRTELLTRLRKGDLTVAKAGHLRKAIRSGDTELAHALMPKSVNPKKYHAMIGTAQKKITKKINEGFVSFGEYIAETTTKKQKARAKWQRIDHILNAQHHIWKNLSKGIDHEDQEPQAKVTHKSMRLAIDSINRKLRKAVKEDIELIPVHRDQYVDKRKAADVHKAYGSKTYSSDKVVKKKNLGQIHPGYDLHQHSVEINTGRGKERAVKHRFTIVHRASGDVAGEMHAWGGKLHPIKGVVRGTSGKGLKVSHLEVHPDHREKKIGASLPVEMYRHLHRRGHAIQSDAIQSHGAAHVWNTMRQDRELKKHMMIHDDGTPVRGQVHSFEKRAYRRPERHIWYQHSRNWSSGREKVEGSHGDEPETVKTLILSGKKRKKKTVKEDIEMAQILAKPHGGYHRDFAKLVANRGITPKRSGRIAKGYTLHTSTDKDDPKIQNHHIVHDATNHVAGEVTTVTHGKDHTVIHTEIHGDHTKKKIGKSLAMLAYKHLARKKGNLWSSNLQSPGGASVWNRLRKDPKMRGRVFHSPDEKTEVPAHDLPDNHIWASENKVTKTKGTPEFLPSTKHGKKEHLRVLFSRLVIRHPKKS
jgi:predicted N-acetyltransferase YhbS